LTSISRSRIPLFLFILLGVVSLSGVEIVPDLRKIEPLALATDHAALRGTQRKVIGLQGRADSLFPVFIKLSREADDIPKKIRGLGGEGRTIHPRLYTARIPRDATRYISNWKEVFYIEAGKQAKPLLDLSGASVSSDDVHAGTTLPPPFTAGLSGNGIHVGIVDAGLSGNHPDFSAGGNSRVVHTFSFSTSSNPLIDEDGHGTHVTGIAAGNGAASGGKFTGMAPGSSILVGKAGTSSFDTTAVQSAVFELLSFAGSAPVAINLSLGAIPGPHDGTSLFEEGLNTLATGSPGSKRIIAAAAGNERTHQEHFQVTLPPFGSVNAPLSLETDGSFIDVWADGADRYTVTATLGSESASAPSGSSASTSSGRISVFNRTDAPPNGATHISVFFTAPAVSPATVLLERTRNGGNGKMDAYIDQSDGFFTTATEAGTISEPANASNIIAVGSFDTKSVTNGNSVPSNISSFSSLGPTRDGRQKPDLTAPGFVIYSARSLEATFEPFEIVSGNDNYVILAGTSMSAPHVTGIAALVWQSNTALTGSQMRERLRRTATPVPPAPNTTWGYGKANALAAVSASVASITAPATAAPRTLVTLPSEKSSGAFGNPLLYLWTFTSRPTGSGASLSAPTAASTTFTPDLPGNYRVSLTVSQASPPGTAPGTAEATVHVNNVPLAAIAGPGTDNVGIPVSFSGVGSTDSDSQPLTLRWVLVSRPAGSSATLLPTGSDNASLTSDVAGTYEVGLRADDGLDNSALVTKILTATGTAPPQTGGDGGGGGGCSMGTGKGEDDGSSSLAALLPLLLPLGVLSARKRGYRFLRRRRSAATKCR
jgi:subtilisin family serine protease